MKDLDAVLADIRNEVLRAELKHAPMHSAHEGYSVILEELDELWDEVRKQSRLRSTGNMETECVQIAAMAIRFVLNILWNVRADAVTELAAGVPREAPPR